MLVLALSLSYRKIIFYGTSYSFSIIKRIRSRSFRSCEVNERIFFFNREVRYKISSLSNLSRYEKIRPKIYSWMFVTYLVSRGELIMRLFLNKLGQPNFSAE